MHLLINVSVCPGFHNTVPQTQWPEDQTLIFSPFLRLETYHEGAGNFRLW